MRYRIWKILDNTHSKFILLNTIYAISFEQARKQAEKLYPSQKQLKIDDYLDGGSQAIVCGSLIDAPEDITKPFCSMTYECDVKFHPFPKWIDRFKKNATEEK